MNLVAAVWEQVVEKTLSSVANMEGEEGGRGVSDSAWKVKVLVHSLGGVV